MQEEVFFMLHSHEIRHADGGRQTWCHFSRKGETASREWRWWQKWTEKPSNVKIFYFLASPASEFTSEYDVVAKGIHKVHLFFHHPSWKLGNNVRFWREFNLKFRFASQYFWKAESYSHLHSCNNHTTYLFDLFKNSLLQTKYIFRPVMKCMTISTWISMKAARCCIHTLLIWNNWKTIKKKKKISGAPTGTQSHTWCSVRISQHLIFSTELFVPLALCWLLIHTVAGLQDYCNLETPGSALRVASVCRQRVQDGGRC